MNTETDVRTAFDYLLLERVRNETRGNSYKSMQSGPPSLHSLLQTTKTEIS